MYLVNKCVIANDCGPDCVPLKNNLVSICKQYEKLYLMNFS